VNSDALVLAALASAAVPGLRPARVELLADRPGDRFTVAVVQDPEHRRWVARLPVDAVAGGQQEGSVTLLGLLARRVAFAVPAPKGFAALRDGRRAMVYPLINGSPLAFAGLPGGPGLAGELGRAIASVHNVDRRLFEEAALPGYTADECRRRHLVNLDRGAASGVVPVGLLARWERLLDDVSRWRFAPTPTHGRLEAADVLVEFEAPDDIASGRVRGVLGWEDAKVGDPAEDFAALVSGASTQAVDTVLEAYAMSRIEHPDPDIAWRAGLVAELRLLEDFLVATSARDRQATAAATHALRRLDVEVGDPDTPPAPVLPDPAVHVWPAGPTRDDRIYQGGSAAPAAALEVTEPGVDDPSGTDPSGADTDRPGEPGRG